MQKFIFAIILSCIACATTDAQGFIDQVPSNATLVIKYSGENLGKAVPLQKLDRYNFIREDFFKILHIDTLTSLQHIGIDPGKDFYQYVAMQDTCISFVTLLNLKNEAQFVKLIKANYGSSKKIMKKKGYSFMPISESSYVAWNKTKAVIVNTNYQNRKSYYSYYPDYGTTTTFDTTVVMAPVEDTAVAIEDMTITTPKMDTGEVKPGEPYEVTEEGVKMESTEDSLRHVEDSLSNLKWELWQQQQDMIAKKQQQVAAENIISNTFSGNIVSIKNEATYNKIIDPAAHVSVWMNAEDIFSLYSGYFNRGLYGPLGTPALYKTDSAGDFKSSVNMYFEKDRVRMEQKSFSTDPKMNALMLDVMNSRPNTDLLRYVNPGNIGYFSISINTEAMANYYYSLMRKYLSNSSYMKDYADVIDLYIDLLEIIIDERSIADLMPGNYIFVMHDMKPQIVDYTDYEYDEEYNRKEVKKTRKEISPDFTFAIETKKEGFMEKLARLPLKYAEKDGYNYKKRDGYYELAFDTGKYPITSLYFMVKNGKAIVTTSKEVINMTINNTAFPTDAEARNSILNNNYAVSVNTKRLIEKLETQISTDVNKKISEYLLANMGDLKMESRIKDGMIQGTATLNIKGNHNNSLEFFFNMIDAINNIMEQDRQEKEKKLY
ncbi:MAG TPA: DUF4836 family protein [Ferruginibacter sp.]|jgi:hypothetical protein|nr:DUF4836 family protein [Ferruginibacter sp.]